MTSKIKPRYDSLDLLPLGHSRFLAMSAAAKKKMLSTAWKLSKTRWAICGKRLGLVEEAFESREQAVDAICRAVQYEGQERFCEASRSHQDLSNYRMGNWSPRGSLRVCDARNVRAAPPKCAEFCLGYE